MALVSKQIEPPSVGGLPVRPMPENRELGLHGKFGLKDMDLAKRR